MGRTTANEMNAHSDHKRINWNLALTVAALVSPWIIGALAWAFGSVATREYVDKAIEVHATIETERFNRYAETTDKLEDLLTLLRLEWAANKRPAVGGGPAAPPTPRNDKAPPDDAPPPPEQRPDPLEVQRQLDELIRQVREIKKE